MNIMTMSRLLMCCLICLISISGYSQYTSRLGRFQVDQVRGCVPFTITIINVNVLTADECTGRSPCLMDFNGSQSQNTHTFTYSASTTRRLSVLYQSIGSDDIQVIVDPNILPLFETSFLGNQVSVRITDTNYDRYAIDFGDGSPIALVAASANQIALYTYVSKGIYNISVQGRKLGATNNCGVRVLAVRL